MTHVADLDAWNNERIIVNTGMFFCRYESGFCMDLVEQWKCYIHV